MTQELVAGMLGVRRESVTEAAGNLPARRADHQLPARPHLRCCEGLRSRKGLEHRCGDLPHRACEC
jgi:hypothetical protein